MILVLKEIVVTRLAVHQIAFVECGLAAPAQSADFVATPNVARVGCKVNAPCSERPSIFMPASCAKPAMHCYR
jgi:hypothetical protein